ncbi:MAG: signal transduction histidine kinase [Myxococcota bacterium]|jgi:signal transduction histidine kinase
MANATLGTGPDRVGGHRGDVSMDRFGRSQRSGPTRAPGQGTGAAGGLAALGLWLVDSKSLIDCADDMDAVAQTLLAVLNDHYPTKQSALFVVQGQTPGLEVAAVRGLSMSDDEARWVKSTADESLSRCEVLGRETAGAELSSFLLVPVLCGGERVGVIQLGDCERQRFAGAGSRELSVLADDFGCLITRTQNIAANQHELDRLRREVHSQGLRLREMERQVVANADRDAVAQLAVRIASNASSPSSALLGALENAREDAEAMQGVVERLTNASRAILIDVATPPCESDVARLNLAVAEAEDARFCGLLTNLVPLIDDVEEGAARLRAVGNDFRELALADLAPVTLTDMSGVVEDAIRVVAGGGKAPCATELQLSSLPPVPCQRLRIEGVLVGIIDHAWALAQSDSGLRIQAELRGDLIAIEVSVDRVEGVARADGASELCEAGWPLPSEPQQRLYRQILEDHDGQFRAEVHDDLVLLGLSLPLTRD